MITGSAGDHRCGVGDYAWCLAQFLAIDAEVDLYYARDHAPVDPPFRKLKKLRLMPVGGYSVLAIPALANRLSLGGYDIVHLQYPSKGYGTSVGPGVLFSRLTGMQSRSRLVLTLHEWSTSHPLRRRLSEQILSATDGLLVTNEAELEKIINVFTLRPVTALPVGNVTRAPAQLESIWMAFEGTAVPGLPAITGPHTRERCSIFHYGLPAKGKGIGRLLEALSIVRKTGIEATLHFYGDLPAGDQLGEEVLGFISKFGLSDAVVRGGHIPQQELEATATRYAVGVFPFDEGYSSKRSSIASISHIELPLVVGGGSREEHPYYAPEENTAKSLAVLLVDLFKGRLEQEWTGQIEQQREYAVRFSFPRLASAHLEFYRKLRREIA